MQIARLPRIRSGLAPQATTYRGGTPNRIAPRRVGPLTETGRAGRPFGYDAGELITTVELAHRAYGSESTRDERAAIAERVSLIGERVLLMREMPIQSPFSVTLMFDRLEALTADWDRFGYVVDLTDAGRPGPETRAVLKERVLRISPRVTHVAIVVGGNLIMRAMARLFAYGMGLRSVAIHETRAEAIEEVGRAMGR